MSSFSTFADQIDTDITTQMKNEKVESLAVGRIHDNGSKTDIRYYNSSDKSLFRMASFSKMLTAIVVLQMVEEGTLQLDKPMVELLPTFNVLTDQQTLNSITLKQVLSHTAGLSREISDIFSNVPRLEQQDFPDLTEFHLGVSLQPVVFKPGTRLKYSNQGYTWLTELIAAKSKFIGSVSQKYAQEVEKRIFKPLGMKNSTMLLSIDKEPELLTPYGMIDPETGVRPALPKVYDVRVAAGGWGFVTNASDLMLFLQWLLKATRGETQVLLKSTTAQQAFAPVMMDTMSPFGYGLGFQTFVVSATEKWIGHGGTFPGYRSAIWVNPATNRAAFVMANAIDLNRDWYIAYFMKDQPPAPMPPPPPPLADSFDCFYVRINVEQDKTTGEYVIKQGKLVSKLIPTGIANEYVIEDNQPYSGWPAEPVMFDGFKDGRVTSLLIGRGTRCSQSKLH